MNNKPTTGKLFFSFLRLGLTAFGGPAMVAYIKEMAVFRHKWLDEETFKDGVVLCQAIPGATAMQVAAYAGFRIKGMQGAFAAFVGFGLPAFVLMLVLSSLYAKYHTALGVASLFKGLQAVVVAIVAHAAYSFGKSTCKQYRDIILAVAVSLLFWMGISPFVVLLCAGLAGTVFLRGEGIVAASPVERKTDRHRVKNLSVLFVILLSGLLVLYLMDAELFDLAMVMMKIDTLAFGGGFASVPLMLHEIVEARGWIDGKTFMDGIALGQVTPGPIVITAAFVGFMKYGIVGAGVATIAMFTPSFFLVIALTPVMERLKSSSFFLSATRGMFASFAGLLFFVTATFALAVPWDILRAALACTALAALVKGVDILYLVLITAVVSIFLL